MEKDTNELCTHIKIRYIDAAAYASKLLSMG